MPRLSETGLAAESVLTQLERGTDYSRRRNRAGARFRRLACAWVSGSSRVCVTVRVCLKRYRWVGAVPSHGLDNYPNGGTRSGNVYSCTTPSGFRRGTCLPHPDRGPKSWSASAVGAVVPAGPVTRAWVAGCGFG